MKKCTYDVYSNIKDLLKIHALDFQDAHIWSGVIGLKQ